VDSRGCGATLPAARQGAGRVEVSIPRLGFGPGDYQITVGFWPGEILGEALDVQHAALRFTIPGEVGSLADLEPALELTPAEPAGPPRPETPIGELTVEHLDGRQTGTFLSGEGLRASARVDTRGLPRRRLVAELEYEGRTLMREIHPGVLGAGQVISLRLVLGQLRLLQGAYTLRLLLLDPKSGERHGEASSFLLVASDQADGRGLINFPVQMAPVDPPPAAGRRRLPPA
jgi:hypothetical protein